MKPVKTIEDTIHQTRPIESLQTEVLLTLVRTVDRVTEHAVGPLASLSTPQYNVLRILRGSREGLQTQQVCERLVSRAPNITRLVDKLESKGLLTRERSRGDRRVVLLKITEQGLALLEGLDAPVKLATKEAMRGLDTEQLKQLCHLLNLLRHPLEEDLRESYEKKNTLN
ncbi:MAG: MarR family transcriptional regulator [Candidatus Eisenbacteria bacterium]|uniref:MarR family transcriptional regulator n=1 Tax=Eiseniibacteriota bacterium TaxID=2212470 RepID=A0A7Y2E6F6_UNCEI|nr:MarR family transcriptional regulator [Candidatus Eisenbacteria bacterium]